MPAARPSRFVAAFEVVLGNELDRRILLELRRAGREVRYEELRKVVREPSPQTFKYAVDRLAKHALLNRRLQPQGERFWTFFSPTRRGLTVADIFHSLASEGTLPADLKADVREDVRRVFSGDTGAPASAPA